MKQLNDFLLSGLGGLLSGIGLLLAGLAALARILKEWKWPGSDVRKKLLRASTAVALAVALIGLIILLIRTPPSSPPCQAELTVTSPTAGAVVNLSETVIGQISCLNPDQHAWLVIQPGGAGGGGYFPQDPISVASNARTWSTSAHFGRPPPADNGRPFTLLAVIADDVANKLFGNFLANNAGSASGTYPGLAHLSGATVLAQVTVTRGPFQ